MYRLLGSQSSFSSLMMLIHYILNPMISDVKSPGFKSFLFCGNCVVFLWMLSKFISLSLVFNNCGCDISSDVGILWVYSLYFAEHFAFLNLNLSPNLKNIWHSSANMFYAPIFLLSFWESRELCIRNFHFISQFPQSSVHCLNIFSLSVLQIWKILWICFSVSCLFTFSSTFSYCANTAIFEFQILYFSVLKFWFGYFF